MRVRTGEPLQGGAVEQAWLTLKAPSPSSAQRHLAGPSLAAPDGAAAGDALPSAERASQAEGEGEAGLALSRLEFEYAIPTADAEALLALTEQRLVKCRHGLDLPGGDWVLDVFEAENAPLVVAEVELEHPDQAVDLPAWCIRELTGRRDLSNAALAARPLARWSEAERCELLRGL